MAANHVVTDHPGADNKAQIVQEVNDAVSPVIKSDVPSDSDSDSEFDPNPFTKPHVASYWRQVYEDAQYESRHAFDPTLEWTEQEEKDILRKLDWRVCLWAVSNAVSVAIQSQLVLLTTCL